MQNMQVLGVGDRQVDLVCCSPWSCKESDMTERLNWTDAEYIYTIDNSKIIIRKLTKKTHNENGKEFEHSPKQYTNGK